MDGLFNPSIFKGEQAFGTTAGAPLSTDAANQVTSGITNGETNATAGATSTVADAVMTGMTTTPVAGTYMVWFSCDLNSAAAGVVVTVQIYVGGVANAGSQRKIMPFAGGTLTSGSQRVGCATQCVVVVNGSQAIETHWSSSTAGATVAGRTMNWLRVA